MMDILVHAFYNAIQGGTMTIDNVPEAFREDVQTLITANSTTEGAVE